MASALLLILSPALALLWTESLEPGMGSLESSPEMAIAHREISPSPFRTDAGRPLPVHECSEPPPPADLARVVAGLPLANRIRTGDASAACNCHGWVFTGGRCWVKAPAVELILADNGYEPVSQPRPRDLIVYRRLGTIVHSGIVRAADDHGVLIESKFGVGPRCVHTSDNSPYGHDYTYYRSGRPGHLVHGWEPPFSTFGPGQAALLSP